MKMPLSLAIGLRCWERRPRPPLVGRICGSWRCLTPMHCGGRQKEEQCRFGERRRRLEDIWRPSRSRRRLEEGTSVVIGKRLGRLVALETKKKEGGRWACPNFCRGGERGNGPVFLRIGQIRIGLCSPPRSGLTRFCTQNLQKVAARKIVTIKSYLLQQLVIPSLPGQAPALNRPQRSSRPP
ncbi:hypothetical protein SAY86_009604 [Trapa natans]|uniref:Uncharacterized protein n=1 Tax=Trapa natans TaxID=22666 RepID=A0AAN7KYP1_TRANT|nr:hypothetical protein SAY86_009604 [Trapa natans]